MKISYSEDEIPQAVSAMIEAGHAQYEQSHSVEINYQRFVLTAEENDVVVGVLIGYTAYAEVYIDDLWVDRSFRKRSIGTRLIEALETRFAGSIFDYICLCTSEFQAPAFYEKCGFELEFKRLNERNPKFNKYFYIKYLH